MIRRLLRSLLVRVGAIFNQGLIAEMRAQQKQMRIQVKEAEDRITTVARRAAATAERAAARQDEVLEAIGRDVRRQLAEMQLIVKRLEHGGRPLAEGGPRIAVSASDLPARSNEAVVRLPVPDDSTLELSACPVCGALESTLVCEYNKLLLLDSGIDPDVQVYNYALCHDCGIVSARRRPVGSRYAYLLDRFEVALGRAQDGIPPSGNLVLNSGSLSDEDRRMLRERVSKGVFVSEHAGMRRRDYLPALLQDRMSNSVHVEILGSLLSLRDPRVLELRPRLGSIGAALKRLYGADVYGMPLFDGQQFLMREAYGIPADHKVSYDHFTIPYEGQFDLVIANHMFTHSLRPREWLSTVRERLTPGGHLYLYNEPDERDFLEDGKSMINSLNAFHVQTFNTASLARGLSAAGFEPTFITHHGGNLIALAKPRSGDSAWSPMTTDERDRRLAAYAEARDLAILKLPDGLRSRFAGEWDAIIERAFVAGRITFDKNGTLRLVKPGRAES